MESSHPPPATIYLVILIGLLLCSMFFSAAETAFISSSRLHIRYLKEKKHKAAARVEKLLVKKTLFLNTILVGNNIVNITTSSIVTALAVSAFGDAGVGIATAIATVIILVFGEILPKSVALMQPERIALRMSLPVTILVALGAPFVFIFTLITSFFAFILGDRKKIANSTVTEEDIKALIEVGEQEGVIESRERDMMHNILHYSDLNTRDIMTPRTNIVSVKIHATKSEILEISHMSRYSRFPVYGDDIDDIRGILYIKDFLFAGNIDDESFSVNDILRPALFIFETQKISAAQKKLRAENQNIAIVIDEYGGVSGLITTEDLVEEIFGGIRDEYDKPTEKDALFTDADIAIAWPITVTGSERLDNINERLSIHIDSNFYDSIGGFIMERLGDIPVSGSYVIEQGYSFTVIEISGNRIDTVKVNKMDNPS
jgi:putative hemolysin